MGQRPLQGPGWGHDPQQPSGARMWFAGLPLGQPSASCQWLNLLLAVAHAQ